MIAVFMIGAVGACIPAIINLALGIADAVIYSDRDQCVPVFL
jgi:hypothetical protein